MSSTDQSGALPRGKQGGSGQEFASVDSEIDLDTSRGVRVASTVIGIAIVIGLIVVAVSQSRSAPGAQPLGPGSALPLATGSTLDGNPIALASFVGKPLVVNLWASWCAPCRLEAPGLAAVARARSSVAFIGVNVRDQPADAKAFVSQYSIPYPSLVDPRGEVEAMFGANGIPTTLFVDSSGIIRRTWIGPLDERQLNDFVEELR